MSPEFLTQEGFEKLEAELAYLRNEKRKEVAARLHEAAESSLGEFVEDPEFEAAKNEQSFVEGRIRELELLLANAKVIEKKKNKNGEIEVGSVVVIVYSINNSMLQADDSPRRRTIVRLELKFWLASARRPARGRSGSGRLRRA